MPKGIGYGQKGVRKRAMPKMKTGAKKPRIGIGKRSSPKVGGKGKFKMKG